MARAQASGHSAVDAEVQLDSFVSKFSQEHQALIRGVRMVLQERFPTAHELVYDNYNFFVIGYSPTERPSDSVLSIVASANGVALCFIQGASLADPDRLLLGSGKQTRSIRIGSVDILADARVRALIDLAERGSRVPFAGSGSPSVAIRSVSAKQRPRRKPQN